MSPVQLFKYLADDTRLRSLLLINHYRELCVCELTVALDVSQPKISRHLAQLRNGQLLEDRRQGQWVFYRLNPALPDWVTGVLDTILTANTDNIATELQRLQAAGDLRGGVDPIATNCEEQLT